MKLVRRIGLGLSAFSLAYALGETVQQYSTLQNVEPIGRYSTPHVVPAYRIDKKDADPQPLTSIFDALENVPDPIQQRVNDLGGTVVICDSIPPHTDEEIEDIRNVANSIPITFEEDLQKLLDDLLKIAEGEYRPLRKEAFVKAPNTVKPELLNERALHEYGHMVDILLGLFSHSYPFAQYWPVQDDAFAGTFARFYLSDRSRRNLKRHRPEFYAYFLQMEKKFIGQRH